MSPHPKRWRQYAILAKTPTVTVRRFILGFEGRNRPVDLLLEVRRPLARDVRIPLEDLNDVIDALTLAREALLLGTRIDR